MLLDLQRFPGYLFDLDGTLIDTAPDIAAAVNHGLERFGYGPASPALVRHWVGYGARACLEQALAEQGEEPDAAAMDALLACCLERYRAHIADRSTPYPGAVEALQALSGRGAKLAVVTNKRIVLTQALLEALQLASLFGAVIGGDSAARPKPAADPILLACEQLGLGPAEALFVGDSPTDVAGARAAGCPVVCVSYGYSHGIAPAQLGADAVIDSLQALA